MTKHTKLTKTHAVKLSQSCQITISLIYVCLCTFANVCHISVVILPSKVKLSPENSRQSTVL